MTSRASLAGLVARDGARRLDLDLLPPADAAGLLVALIGERAATDPSATHQLASQCAWLPLALRVAAELAAARPATPLANLVAELADQQQRLELLEADGDQRTAIRAVFSWSYRQLPPGTARAFRFAGLHPRSDFDQYAAAALAGCTLAQIRQHLDPLLRAHLIQLATPGGYGMHDLLRDYARELCTAEDSEADRRAALTRLFDHYLHAAAAAVDVLYPAEQHHRPRIAAPATPVPPMTNPAGARAWLDAQRASLTEVAAFTATQGWPGHTIQLATTLWRYLDIGGHYPEAITIHSSAHRAACGSADRAAQAEVLVNLAVVHWRQGRCQQAASHLRQALAKYRETSDPVGQARALNNLGLVDMQQSRYHQAVDHFQQALERYQETGDQAGAASALVNLGLVERWKGRYQQAADHLGHALTLCHETGNRNGVAGALTGLGSVDLQRGRYEQATGSLREALVLFAETGDRCGEAEAHNGLGEVLLAAGQPEQAREQHAAAFGLASQIGDSYEQARAHNGLGHAWLALGDPMQAFRHWQEARSRYADLGTPEAVQVQAQLAAHILEAGGLSREEARHSLFGRRRRGVRVRPVRGVYQSVHQPGYRGQGVLARDSATRHGHIDLRLQQRRLRGRPPQRRQGGTGRNIRTGSC